MAKKITVASYDIDIEGISQKLAKLKQSMNAPDLGEGVSKSFTKQISKIETELAKLENNLPGAGASEAQIRRYEKSVESVRIKMHSLVDSMSGFKISDKYIEDNIQGLKEYTDKIDIAKKKLEQLQKSASMIDYSPQSKGGGKRGTVKQFEDTRAAIQTATEEGNREKIKSEYGKFSKDYKKKMDAVAAEQGINSEDYKALVADRDAMLAIERKSLALASQIKKADAEKTTAENEKAEALKRSGNAANIAMTQTMIAAKETEGSMAGAVQQVGAWADEVKRADEESKKFAQIESRVKSLFSAGMALQTIRRIVRGAIQDFQELDKQFNEIAIVSDYSTKEMWASFSSVNKVAQEFGVTTKNVLEVQNLYYHQGKDMAEVNKLTAQTLTLAKITGMDYERATSDLTAALNAYNIAAEDSARVTDTIAAMDTNAAISSEELMTALTKTASIAANAGMSLESTEVFLTKMIETTREAPENLGTALKTIIARFGEVKQEIDGEEIELIDVNRVDTALRSIGISLLDSAGQIRDLDDVFMELSSVWDDLDRNTQRYIATVAAGSRQQSRFIAMMEDYDRTLELTEIAQNSAGLGAQQLAESMDSIETSVNRLKSSWQEFYSNIITSGAIKAALDVANGFLGILNKMNDFIPYSGLIVGALGLWAAKILIVDKGLVALGEMMGQNIGKATGAKTSSEMYAKSLSVVQIKAALADEAISAETRELLEQELQYRKTAAAARDYNNSQKSKPSSTDGGRKKLPVKLADNSETPTENPKTPELKETAEQFKNDFSNTFTKSKGAAEEKIKNWVKDNLGEGFKLSGKGKNAGGLMGKLGKAGKGIGNSVKGIAKSGITKVLGKVAKFIPKLVPLLGKAAGVIGTIGKTLGGPVVWAITAVISAIVLGIKMWNKYGKASVDDTKAVEKLTKVQEKYNKTLKEYRDLKETVANYTKLHNKQFKTSEELQEEQSAIKELVETYPNLLDHIDEEGNYHLKNAEYIERELDAKKKLAEMELTSYSKLRHASAKDGVYADESTFAGRSMASLKEYYAILDEESIKDLAKEIDKVGGFDSSRFKKLANAYASGEKTSFGYKDFSNLFKGSLTKEEFEVLSKAYLEEMQNTGGDVTESIRRALVATGSYSNSQIDDITKVWTELNEQTGDMYSNLLEGIGEERVSIFAQNAEVFVDDLTSDLGITEEVKDALEGVIAVEAESHMGESSIDYRLENLLDHFAPVEGGFFRMVGMTPEEFALEWAEADVRNAVKEATAEEWKKADEILKNKDSFTTTDYETMENGEFAHYINTYLIDYYTEVQEQNKKIGEVVAKQVKLDEGFLDGVTLRYNEFLKNAADGIKNAYTAQQEDLGLTDDELKAKIAEDTKSTQESITVESTVTQYLNERLTVDQLSLLEKQFSQLGDFGGARLISNLMQYDPYGSEYAEILLGIDYSNLDSMTEGIYKLGLTGEEASKKLQELVDIAGGLDNFSFGDAIAEAERLQKKIEELQASLEGVVRLTTGKGKLSDVGSLLNSVSLQFKDIEVGEDGTITEDSINSINKTFEELWNSVSYTSEGISLAGSETEAEGKKLLDFELAEMMTEMQVLKGKMDKAEEQGNTQDYLTYRTDLEVMVYAYNEAQAEYERSLHEEKVEALEEELEKLNEKKDVLKDLVDWLREYDRYANLDETISTMKEDFNNLDFEINFSTNTDVVEKDLEEQVNNINSQIAANQGGIAAAKDDQKMWRDTIQKRNSEYVSFDASGNAIVNAEKMRGLQEEIASADEEQREVLQAEYDEIMDNVDAYNKAKDKVNDYSKALQDNFKELEDFLNNTYENVKKVEDKLIELRMEAEDKELEAVRDKYDAIQEENDEYLDSIRDMIDKERKIRDRANQEQDVKDKEKKLAMMKMDTSGIYAKDIQSLEKELENDYQSLEDNAVDSAVEKLEQDYEQQAEMYDKDIEFMENSLQYKREKMTEYNTWATQLLQQGSDAVMAYLKANDEEYYTGTAAAQALWESEWNGAVTRADASNQFLQSSLLNTVKNALDSCKEAAGGFEQGVKDYSETATTKNGEVAGTVSDLTTHYQNLAGGVRGVETAIDDLADAYDNAKKAAKNLKEMQDKVIFNHKYIKSNNIEGIDDNSFGGGNSLEGEMRAGSQNNEGNYTTDFQWYIVKAQGSDTWETVKVGGTEYVKVTDGLFDYAYIKKSELKTNDNNKTAFGGNFKLYWPKYETGGFAYETGPAWLDGTSTKPEAVLNALQTKHFIQFTNVLDTLFSGHPNLTSNPHQAQKSGDANYTFYINVDQMASDYDVDRLIKRIEEKATKASQYRNVTVVKKSN